MMKKSFISLSAGLLLSTAWLIPMVQAANYTNSIRMKFKNIPAGSCKLSDADKAANKKLQEGRILQIRPQRLKYLYC